MLLDAHAAGATSVILTHNIARRLLQWISQGSHQALLCAGSYFSAGGIDQKKASWYMLLFVQEGIAEKLLQADDWRLLKAIISPGVTEAAHKAYIADLSRPGRLTAG